MFHLKRVRVKDILSIEDLTMSSKKTTCIIGPSGSGKSTLLRLLNALISPDEGMIFYNEKSLDDIDPVLLRREVVMLQQNPIIYEGTVKDNITIGLKFAEKEPVSDQELQELIAKLKLHTELNEDAAHLSGGEKQRLALARVLVMRPQVLLLDEPTSSLDEQTAQDVIELVLQYSKALSCAVIMITHSNDIVEKFAEEIIDLSNYSIIHRGKE